AVKPDTAGVRVLSIDGGGTRGRAPLEFLQALQDRLGLPYPLQRNFDLIYGTSSGAIIAAVLYAHNWRIEDCTKYFQFRYSSESLEIILQKTLGSRSIMAFPCAAAFGTKLGIPVTTIRDATACVFTSYIGIASDYHILKPSGGMGQIPLWEIVRCSTAAPYYFKPRHIMGLGTFQDGGLMLNNPASIALEETTAIFPLSAEPSLVVSLGTGSAKPRSPTTVDPPHFFHDSFPARVYRAFWNSSSSRRAWQQLMNHKKLGDSSEFFRFDLEFEGNGPGLDNVSEMEEVGRLARESIETSPTLPKLVQHIRAQLFVFELSSTPITYCDGRLQCRGPILCRLAFSTKELKVFLSQLQNKSASLRIINKALPHCFQDPIPQQAGIGFCMEVQFTVASRTEPFSIVLCEEEGTECNISGSPFTLQSLIRQQNMESWFGTADHRKRRLEASYEGGRGKRARFYS
ncbi:hypothetical protein JX266_013990, partial [Neoarthrinium moseri]